MLNFKFLRGNTKVSPVHVIGAILLKIFQHSLVTASKDIRYPLSSDQRALATFWEIFVLSSVAITLRGIFASVANPTDVSQEIVMRAANIP
jgi:hypothetical protein